MIGEDGMAMLQERADPVMAGDGVDPDDADAGIAGDIAHRSENIGVFALGSGAADGDRAGDAVAEQ